MNTIDDRGDVSTAPAGMVAALDEVLAGWNAAAMEWNPDALAALYTEDVLMFGGRPHMSVGRSAAKDYFASYHDTFLSVRLKLVDQYVLEIAPATLLAQGFGEFSFRLANGRMTSTTMRTTLILVKHLSGWKIRLHHFSSIPERPPIGDEVEQQAR